MPSTVAAAQAELTAIIEATFAASTTHRQFGLPLEVPRKHERVYVFEDEVDYAISRAEQWTNEVYVIQVAIEVYKAGKASLPAVTRRRAMQVSLHDALLAADFYGWASEGYGELSVDAVTAAHADGWLAKAILDVPVIARLA